MTEPSAAPSRRTPGPWIFVAAGAVLLLCCAWPVYAIYTWRSNASDEAAMKPVAAAYLDALVKDDRPAGYALLCDSRRRQVSAANFSAITHTQPSVVGYQIKGARVETNEEAPDSYFVDVDLRYSDKSTRSIALLMADDPSGWKVCTDRGY